MSIEPLTTKNYADLHVEGTFFSSRTTVEQIWWVYSDNLVYRVEAATGATIGLMGEMPLVCHQATATPAALEFMSISGLSPPKYLHTYGTEVEAISLTQQLIESGLRQVYYYPPSPALSAPEGLLVPLAIYNAINDKLCIPEFINEKYLPRRRVVPVEEISRLDKEPPGYPIYIKAGIQGANGWGAGVRYCHDDTVWRKEIAWFQSKLSELSGLVIEEAIDVTTCWCLGVSILNNQCQYLGGSIQLFRDPAMQSGNRIDPDFQVPDEAIQVALAIAKNAQQKGYRGIAGFDIGVDRNNRLFVFDLNFRLNGSTAQLLIHDAAAERIGACVSQSWNVLSDDPLDTMLERLVPFVEKGIFVPTRFFDQDTFHEYYPGIEAKSVLAGIVFANAVAEIAEIDTAMNSALHR